MFILDNLENPDQTIQFFTDGVMGRLSSREVNIEEMKNKKCYQMTDNVTTKNNGGFDNFKADLAVSEIDFY